MSYPASLYEEVDDGEFVSTELTRGPWSPQHQHGGPPSALIARALEQEAARHGLSHLPRLTVSFFRPIPIARLQIRTGADRAGRKAAYLWATVAADGKEVARATAVALATEPVEVPEEIPSKWASEQAPKTPEESEFIEFPFMTGEIGYHKAIEGRLAAGQFFRGPSAVWFRMQYPLIPEETPSPIQRVAIAADSGNGISASLDMFRYTFVNPDLSIHLLRGPVGDWICLDARSLIGPDGTGMAEGRIFDRGGLAGRSVQSLIVRPRDTD